MIMTYAEAIRDTMRQEMRKDPMVFLAGEDISVMGGSFGCSVGLIDESFVLPAAVGPVMIISFCLSITQQLS